MLPLLLIIISYASLLLLLMPATGIGVITMVGILIVGIGLILYKNVYKMALGKRNYLIPIAMFISTYLGLVFYNRWIPSSKMEMMATMIHMPTETMLLIGSLLLTVLSVYFIYAVLEITIEKTPNTDEKNNFLKAIISCVIAAVVTVISAQIMIETEVLSMGYVNFIWAILIVLTAILFLLCLLGKAMLSILLGTGIFMIVSTINVYVYSFRERLFEPVDIFSAGTAMNVAGSYDLFPIPTNILTGWGIFVGLIIILCYWELSSKSDFTVKKRLALLSVCIISFIAIFFYVGNLKTYHWHNEGARFNGYILDFVSKFKEISASKPENYNQEKIAELAEQYASDKNDPKTDQTDRPHIIIIMDEAFSDLHVVGEFETNIEIMPFISSLKKNTISGYALASVYGGNTANSEYEFLTGNSLAWLSPNVVPYQQYIRSSTYSMVSYLKSSFDYKTVAMHPFKPSGWNRPVAYKHLGFDECFFVEDFPQKKYVRNYVSDQEMFEFFIKTYESHREEPLFIFGVTMQNHGGYTYTGENYTQSISLSDHEEFPEVEQYISLIHETDKAVEYLVTYFESVDEDVVIVFFGDHQPKISDVFYETISGTSADTLDEQQKRYEVPFFIWSNYDIEEKYIDCTSLNYLSSYVYDVAGINLPPYNQFLSDMETAIPAINANGFYSLDARSYLPFDEANKDEAQWLELYEMLQYNNLFDKRHYNETLFPVLDMKERK